MANPDQRPDAWPVEASSGSPTWFGQMDQDQFEIDFYELVLRRNPNYLQALRCLGELLSRKGLYDRSLEVDRRIVQLLPDDCVARYNLACGLAMSRRPNEAIDELRRAIEQGYCDFGYLEVDSDLDGLRNEPAYDELLREYGIRRPSESRRRKQGGKKKKD